MDLPVHAEREPVCKGLATLLAGQGVLATVWDLVLLQIPWGGKPCYTGCTGMTTQPRGPPCGP